MTMARYGQPRDEPFYWWGPVWAPQHSRTLTQLVNQELLSAREAAVLAVLYRRGASLFVISRTSGACKSTLLDAIVQSGSQYRDRIYLRGSYETFDFLDGVDVRRCCLLVNEISPHLPIYLWGGGVGRFLHAAAAGYQLCATSHAADARSFIHLLTTRPLDVPLAEVHRPKVVVTLSSTTVGEDTIYGVRSISAITPGTTPQGTALNIIAERGEPGTGVQVFPEALASFLQAADIETIGFFEEAAEFGQLLNAAADSHGAGPRRDES